MSPGRRQEPSEIDKLLLSLGFEEGKGTQTGSGVSESEKSKKASDKSVREQASQWDFEDSQRARSLSGLPPFSDSRGLQVQSSVRDRPDFVVYRG